MTQEIQSNTAGTTQPSRPAPKRPARTTATLVTRLLARSKGATLTEIGNATGWQPHSCRAFLTGLRKKGEDLLKEQRPDSSTAYRIATSAPDGSVS